MRKTLMYRYVMCAAAVLVITQQANAQGVQILKTNSRTASGRTRDGGIPRNQVLQQQGRNNSQGTEEGVPRLRVDPDNGSVRPRFLPPQSRRWKLGVYAYNTGTGVVVTRVVSRSAAARMGLEPGDRIVAVNGFQVGWVQDRLYPLGEELQRRAGQRGYVTLLLQNVRTNGLLMRDVKLELAGFPRPFSQGN